MIPGVGLALIALTDGGSQLVGSIFLALLVDIDGNHAVLALDDLDQVLADIDGPLDFVSGSAHRNAADASEVLGSLLTYIFVHSLNVGNGIFQAINRGGIFHHRSVLLLLRLFLLLTACENAKAKCQQENPCYNFFHSYLLTPYN